MDQTSGDKLDILFAGTLPPHPGGSAISAATLLAKLAARGHRVRCIAPITSDLMARGDGFAARHGALRVSRFIVPQFETAPWFPAAAADRNTEHRHVQNRLRVSIEEHRPDIILIGRETFALHAVPVARELRIPSLLRVAGGTLLGLSRGSYPAPLVREYVRRFGEVDTLIAPSGFAASELRKLGLQNVDLVMNAVDLEQFRPSPRNADLMRQLRIDEDQVVIGHLANMNDRKRPMDVVASAEKTLSRFPGIVYLMAGVGPLREAVEAECRRKGLQGSFRFVGWVEHERVSDYINLCDIVVMASDGEGLARVYLETQACGKVILASDIAPAREVISDGENGLLFRLGDVGDLAGKTVCAASDPAFRAVLGQNARRRVQAHSLDLAAGAYIDRMRAVLETHRLNGRAQHTERPANSPGGKLNN